MRYDAIPMGRSAVSLANFVRLYVLLRRLRLTPNREMMEAVALQDMILI
jgi:hypothetical protein